MTMQLGEKARITATPDYAVRVAGGSEQARQHSTLNCRRAHARAQYGAGGFPAWGIMPNSTLVFEIEARRTQLPRQRCCVC